MEQDSANSVRVPLANVNIIDSDITATKNKVQAAQQLVVAGFDPAGVLEALGLPPIPHTGVPSSQLQPVAQIDEADPESVYDDEVDR